MIAAKIFVRQRLALCDSSGTGNDYLNLIVLLARFIAANVRFRAPSLLHFVLDLPYELLGLPAVLSIGFGMNRG